MSTPYHKMMSRSPDNTKLDFFRTPEDATVALMERENFPPYIWEPACGDGAMSEVIARYCPKMLSTDIVDYGCGSSGYDFLTCDPPRKDFACIITNPPFSLAQEFVERALEVAQFKVAILARLMFLESQRRHELFVNSPLKAVYVFSYRLKFQLDGYDKPISYTPYAWFVWEKTWRKEPVIRWIPKPEET